MFDVLFVNYVLLIMLINLINMWIKEFVKWILGMRVKIFYGFSKDERIRNFNRI